MLSLTIVNSPLKNKIKVLIKRIGVLNAYVSAFIAIVNEIIGVFSLIKLAWNLLISTNWIIILKKIITTKIITPVVSVKVTSNDKDYLSLNKYHVDSIWYYDTTLGLISEESLLMLIKKEAVLKTLLKSGKVLKKSSREFSNKVSLDSPLSIFFLQKNVRGLTLRVEYYKNVKLFNKKNYSQIIARMLDTNRRYYFRSISLTSNLLTFINYLYKLIIRSSQVTKNYDIFYSRPALDIKNKLSSNLIPGELLINLIYFTKKWVVSITLATLIIIVFTFMRDIPLNKHLFAIGSILTFTYLLISGFVFFLKKYRYGKYTTAMHRFWRRSFSIFWALEGFLFVVFMYLTVLCNQEPFFMYDNIQFFKDYTYSWRFFLSENTVVLVIVFILHLALIKLKNTTSKKLNLLIISVTLVYFYLTYIEFYQFYYTISHYNPTVWLFDYEFSKWYIDYETTQTKRTRILLHYITICLIAKFWHFVFILGFWVFSVSKWLQTNSISYQLIGANLQNAIILYLLNWILMYPWMKVAFRKFLFRSYKWLYVNFRSIGLRVFINDLLFYLSNISNGLYDFSIKLSINYLFIYYNIHGSDLLNSDFSSSLLKKNF